MQNDCVMSCVSIRLVFSDVLRRLHSMLDCDALYKVECDVVVNHFCGHLIIVNKIM